MGWRFRRSVKVLPGIGLNFSRSGVSTSIGPRDATLNLGRKGARATVGVPGTGLSYSAVLGHTAPPVRSPSIAKPPVPIASPGPHPIPSAIAQRSSLGISPTGWMVAVAFVLVAVVRLASLLPLTKAPPPIAAAPAVSTRHVEAASVNCRRLPRAAAAVVETLARGTPIDVAAEKGGWSQLRTQNCWVRSSFLSPPLGESQVAAPRPKSVPRSRAKHHPRHVVESSPALPAETGREVIPKAPAAEANEAVATNEAMPNI